MKIRPLGAELIHADGQTDRPDQTNSRFSPILRMRLIITEQNAFVSYNHHIYKPQRFPLSQHSIHHSYLKASPDSVCLRQSR